MAEHDTSGAGQHRQPGWYWVRWTPNGFWFPVQWFRGHDGQEFWVGGGVWLSAAEVGFRIREMGEAPLEDNSPALHEAQDKINYLSQMLAIKSQEEAERLYIDNALPEGWVWTIRKFWNHPWADCGYAEAHSPHEEPVYKTYGHTPSEAFRNVVDQVRGKVEPCGSEPAQTKGDQREGYTMRDDTPVDSDTVARRLAHDVVSKYTTLTGTYRELPHLEQIVDDAIVIALAEKEAEIARLRQALAGKERETIARCAALAEAEPEFPREMPENIRQHIMCSPDVMARSICRTTKGSIARAIRALAGEAAAAPELPGKTPKKPKNATMAHPDPMAQFVPRATKRAIVKEVMRELARQQRSNANDYTE